MRLADIMSTDVARIAPQDSPVRARAVMRQRGIQHLVVVDEHRVKGLLTDRDLSGPAVDLAQSVASLMTRRIATAPPSLTVRKAANLLRGSAVGALPVVDRGRLVGIVTVSDLLDQLGRGVHAAANGKGKRWILKDRGVRPASSRRPPPSR
jgi:acetoin utilization protein AcuB